MAATVLPYCDLIKHIISCLDFAPLNLVCIPTCGMLAFVTGQRYE
jgi:hypothetical protein